MLSASNRIDRMRSKRIWCGIFLFPQMLVFAFFSVYPIIMNVVYSLHEWRGYGALGDLVALGNYREALTDPMFWNAVKNTAIYMVGELGIQLPLALAVAIALNNNALRFRTVYRASYFAPVVTTAAVAGVAMVWIFSPFMGPFNLALQRLGILRAPIDWLGRRDLALLTVIMIAVWKTFGQRMVYWLAGLQSIPEDVYEAARIDGAGWWATLWHITLPLISKTAAVIILISSRGVFQAFDLIMTMTGGGPASATETIDVYIYQHAFSGVMGRARMGYACAVSVLFGLMLIAVAVCVILAVMISNKRRTVRTRSLAEAREGRACI